MQSNSQRFRLISSVILFLMDTGAIMLAFWLAHQLRRLIPLPEEIVPTIQFTDYSMLLIIHIVCVLFLLFINRQYVITRAPSRVGQFYSVITSVTVGTLLGIAAATFLFKREDFVIDYPRAMMLYAWLLTMLTLIIVRLLFNYLRNRLRRQGLARDRLLVVGTGDVARLTLQRIQWSPNLGYEICGIVAPNNGMRRLLGIPVIGAPEQLPELIEQHEIDEVIIAMPEEGHREVVKVVSYCQRGRVSIKIFPDVFQFITSEATIDDLGGLPLLTVRDFALRGYLLVFKRAIDILGSLFGLIILSPFLLLIAILVKIESPGPAFFVQERMGLDGQRINMIKLRSMRKDAEKDGPGWTVEDDPRRTRIGSFLRRTNFDEFPQLINVLLGEMSLVGPRPEQPYYVDQFRETVPDYMNRHQLPSGITGWAQINGLRGDTSVTERTKYDLWYIENWSLLLDITILIRTVWQTLTGQVKGAG